MKKIITALSLICFIFSFQAKASHVSGGEVTYTSLGGNQYKVQLVLYWDCGSFDPGTTASMTATNSCGLTDLTFTVNQDTSYEVSQVCPSSINSTTCNGGNLPGNKKNVYSAIITLPGACSLWTFEHENGARNASTNVPSQPNYDFYAKLNNLVAPTNNSPYFTSQPLPYLCVGQPVCYSPGVVELDGNTLSYSFVSAMSTTSTTPVGYSAGYSGASPMPGITIDPITGLISFTPTMVGNFVVCFLVVEKDVNGVIIGSVIRDIQMVVVNCSNQVIACNAGAVTNLVGFGATSPSPNSIQICENIPFSFTASFTDPDASDILSYTSNILQVLPGATISSSGTNPLTVSVSWTAPPGSANTNTTFALTVADNACPVTGQQTVNYIIQVLPATKSGPDQIICGNQSAALSVIGGSNFTWAVITGSPIVVGTNFSCNSCDNPIATPSITTVYEVTSNLAGMCVNKDTVTVTVVPDFSFVTSQSTATLCLQQPVQFSIVGSPAGAYTYSWSPAATLDNITISNPTAILNTAGTFNYYVNITSPDGCLKKDTVTAIVQPAIRTIVSQDTILCVNQSALLSASGGTSYTWTAITGPAIVAGTNFSCVNCFNPTATPTAVTTYEVTSNLTGTCINKDTVTVNVVPDYPVNTTQSNFTTCLLDSIQLNTIVSAGTYTYSWNPSTFLNNTTIPNPIATISVPGTYSYVLTIKDSPGCVKLDTTVIIITPTYKPDALLTALPSPVCVNDIVQLSTSFASTVPSTCGINPVGCSASLSATIGTGSGFNTATTFPAIYGNWYTSTKHQLLFRASELNAAGLTGGKIDQIDIPVSSINGITTYHQFTIKMGCTNLNALGTSWVGGLFQVFNPATVNIIVGTNTYSLNNAFEWDGISNVVVEICSTEGPGPTLYSNYTQSSISPYSTTAFTSCLYSSTDQFDMCPDLTNLITQTPKRPLLTFHYCGGTVDPTTLTYSWLPSGSVLSPTAQNTGAVVPSNSTFGVIVTDIASGCMDTAYVNVTTIPNTTIVVSASNNVTICPGTPTTLNATGATTYSWSPATSLSSATIANPVASPLTTTTYTVTGTTQCAPPSIDSVTVSAVNSVIINVSAGSDATICPGTTALLNATGASQYTWSPPTALSTTIGANTVSSPATTITYTVTGTAPCANPDTDSVTVNVLSAAQLNVTAGPDAAICVGEPLNLSASTTGGFTGNSYDWFLFSGVLTDTIHNPHSLNSAFVLATQEGTNKYEITVTDLCGNTASDTVIIDVSNDCQLIIPNVFTPNGDGNNDVFLVKGKGIKSFSLLIFNRWGKKVFETSDINQSWNGEGNEDGTYYYVIRSETMNAKNFDKQGYLQLLSK